MSEAVQSVDDLDPVPVTEVDDPGPEAPGEVTRHGETQPDGR